MTDTQRAAFEAPCNALPEGVNWGDRLTPEIAQHITQAAQADDAGARADALYDSAERAHAAYRSAAESLQGEFARAVPFQSIAHAAQTGESK